MSNYNLSHLHLGHDIIKVELPKKKPVPTEFNVPSEMATVSFCDVMENILK